MSKCTLRIVFDAPDRRYRGGGRVNGTAHVLVNQDLACKEIRIETFWKTHGRGNTDRGTVQTIRIADDRRLMAGERLELPFTFIVPKDPLTYRGKIFNVDHYVKLVVDIPWGTNVTAEEEFLVEPGERPDYYSGQRDKVTLQVPVKPVTLGVIAKILIGMLLLFFFAALAMMAIVIVPFILLFGGGYLVHRYLVRSRVGEVELEIPHYVVSPEEPWPFRLEFTPRGNLSIDGVFIQIMAQEICESGTGTDKRTYRETLYQQTVSVAEAQRLTTGERFQLSSSIPLPATTAYSFKSSDNQVSWTGEVRVSIPRWPDWAKKEVLQMVPQEFLPTDGSPPSARPIEAVSVSVPREDSLTSEPLADVESSYEERMNQEQDETLSDEPAMVDACASNMVEVLEEVAQAERMTSARQAVIDAYADRSFSVEVVIERSYSTYGQDDERYNDGTTIIGKLVNSVHPVRLLLLARPDQDRPRWSEGQLWQGDARIVKWDALYQRADLLEL